MNLGVYLCCIFSVSFVVLTHCIRSVSDQCINTHVRHGVLIH